MLLTSGLAQADKLDDFLRAEHLESQALQLSNTEKRALKKTLAQQDRELSNASIAKLLKNPVAWQSGETNSRRLLKTVLHSLPDVANLPGVDQTVTLAARPAESSFRGFGVEVLAAAALNRYQTLSGRKAKVTRMGGMIRGVDGQMRESDGAALVGGDRVPRLVTVKSASTVNSVSGAVKKAADQLALRNEQKNGSRTAGIMMVGFDSPEVLERLQRSDWQAATNRSGADLLVLAVDQLTGAVKRLSRLKTTTDATPPAVIKQQKITEANRLKREQQEAQRDVVRAQRAEARAAKEKAAAKRPQKTQKAKQPPKSQSRPRVRHPFKQRPKALRAMRRQLSRRR